MPAQAQANRGRRQSGNPVRLVNKQFDRYGLNLGATADARLLSCHELYVQSCSGMGCVPNSAVCDQLPKMPGYYDVRSLNCCSNFIGDKGLLALLPIIRVAKTLQRVRLPNNGLKNASVLKLLEEAAAHPSLIAIDLSNNRFLSLDVGTAAMKLLRARKDVIQLSLNQTSVSKKLLADIDAAVKKNRRVADERHVHHIQRLSQAIGRKELLEAKDAFDKMDADGSGRVSHDEVRAHVGPERAQAMFNQLDSDHDDMLTLVEYLSANFPTATTEEILYAMNCYSDYERAYEPPPVLNAWQLAEIKELFNMYDKDADGMVTSTELRRAMDKSNMDLDLCFPTEPMTLEDFTDLMTKYYTTGD